MRGDTSFTARIVARYAARGVWNKPPWRWNLEDVQRLVQQKVPESLTLEYKDSRALARDARQELCKDVSAFANTQGGMIVYGVVADKVTGVPLQVDMGTDPAEINVEWIGQVLQSGVHPRLQGVQISDIPLASGKMIFVVHAPESATVHMADTRYHRRYDRRSVPMEDHEVRAFLDRARAPNVEISAELSVQGAGAEAVLTLRITARNTRPTPAEYFRVNLFLGQGLEVINPIHFVHRGVRDVRIPTSETLRMTWLTYDWYARMPLFEGLEEEISAVLTRARYGERIYWIAEAPRMLTRGGYITGFEIAPLRGLKRLDEAWELLPFVPKPPPPPMSELEQITANETEKASRPEWDETND